MASLLNGGLDGGGDKPPKLSERLSQTFLRPSKPSSNPAPAPVTDRIMEGDERKAAMSGLDAMELKWAKGGMILATIMGILLTLYLSASHPTRKETIIVHGKKVKGLVPISGTWLLLGAVVLLFCALGFIALRRRKRSLVAFSFFVTGFAFTLIFAPLGFALILLGGWLMLRAYRLQRYGTANSKMIAREARARPPRRDRKAAASAPAKPSGYKAPTPNKRYTPKAPTRKKIAKPVE
ncbi:MAG TPA: hypothetical protein VG298_01230 [Acidimicrobiales bacterium]|jgi:hypothetical protein|nr:hypothetical protein [Acidimicrobiales bacterium]